MAAGQLKTLAVRISEDLRAQLDIIAQLTGHSVTEEIRLALEHWIEKTKSDPEILKKAQQVQTEIERRAQTQRDAIAAIFGEDDTTIDEAKASAPPRPDTEASEAATTDETEASAPTRPATRRGKTSG
jgi:predicted DNA-binding protein